MGRTVMPFSHVLESERERWKPFRRALSKEDQRSLTRFRRNKIHIFVSVYTRSRLRVINPVNPPITKPEKANKNQEASSRLNNSFPGGSPQNTLDGGGFRRIPRPRPSRNPNIDPSHKRLTILRFSSPSNHQFINILNAE
jgi:hypothetical protein